MKFGIFYEHRLPNPWGDDDETLCSRTPSTRSSSPTGSASTTSWRSSTTSSRSTRHSSAPEVSSPRAASAPRHPARTRHRAHAAATITRRASPSGSRRSTSSRDGRVEFGTGEIDGAHRAGRLQRRSRDEARACGWRPRQTAQHDGEDPFPGFEGESSDAAPQRRPEAHPEAAPAAVGRVLQPRHHPPAARLDGPGRADLLRSSTPRGPNNGSTSTTKLSSVTTSEPTRLRLNPIVAVVLPMMCHSDEDRSCRARSSDGAHFFGYLLAHHYASGNTRRGRNRHHRRLRSSAATRSASRAR